MNQRSATGPGVGEVTLPQGREGEADMARNAWRRLPSPAIWITLLTFGLPAAVEAQLFPNLPIKRKKEACANEPPFYGQVRHDYFGYFPTCWRKFPDGWACPCPNPEAPNVEAEFQKLKRDEKPNVPPTDLDGLGGDDIPDVPGGAAAGALPPPRGNAGAGAQPAPGPGPGPGANDPDLPALPNRRSPFELDSPKPNAPANPPAGGGAAPGGPVRRPESPFETAPPRTSSRFGNPATRRTSSGVNIPQTPAASLPELPDLNASVSAPATGPLGSSGPELTIPEGLMTDNSATRTVSMGAPMSSLPPNATAVDSLPEMNNAPAQAPKRQGIISGLFNRKRR